MFHDANLMTVVLAAGSIIVGVLSGLLLRAIFGRLACRGLRDAERTWGQFGWSLLRGTVLPAATVAGIWGAVEIVGLASRTRMIVDRALIIVVALAVILTVARIAGSLVGVLAVARSTAGRRNGVTSAAAQAGAVQSATIFVNITRVAVIAVGILVLLQSLGVSITPMLTALGVGGLAVALALQDPLANLFGGVQILASRKVQTGDFIRLDSGEEGYVVDINWRNSSVRQLVGNIIVVPNARLADAVVTNFHQPKQDMLVLVEAGVSYDSDLEHVERVTIEVAREVMLTIEGAVPEHEPYVRFHTFAEYSIQFSVVLRISEVTAQYLIKHEFIKRLHLRFRAEGIVLPDPIRTLVTADAVARRAATLPVAAESPAVQTAPLAPPPSETGPVPVTPFETAPLQTAPLDPVASLESLEPLEPLVFGAPETEPIATKVGSGQAPPSAQERAYAIPGGGLQS